MCSVEVAGIGHQKKRKKSFARCLWAGTRNIKKNNKSFVAFVQCGGSGKKEEARGTKIN